MNQYLVVFLALCLPIGADQPGMQVFFIDVEGGAATLVIGPGGESLLVDSGNPGARDADRIHKVATGPAGLKQVDHYVTTHWHVDHYGGIGRLAELIPIQHFYDRDIPESLQEDKQYFPILIPNYRRISEGKRTVLRPGDELPLKAAPDAQAFTALCLTAAGKTLKASADSAENSCCAANKPAAPDPSDNARSVSLLIRYGSFKFLDCGDLTWNVEYELVCPRDPIGKVDVFQVTHHGLDSSNNPVLVETIQPRVAIFNNGPRKGATPPVMRTLRKLPGLEAIYQLHRNEAVGEDLNTDPAFIANHSADCKGEYIRLAVSRDAKTYSVQVGANGKAQSYRTR